MRRKRYAIHNDGHPKRLARWRSIPSNGQAKPDATFRFLPSSPSPRHRFPLSMSLYNRARSGRNANHTFRLLSRPCPNNRCWPTSPYPRRQSPVSWRSACSYAKDIPVPTPRVPRGSLRPPHAILTSSWLPCPTCRSNRLSRAWRTKADWERISSRRDTPYPGEARAPQSHGSAPFRHKVRRLRHG